MLSPIFRVLVAAALVLFLALLVWAVAPAPKRGVNLSRWLQDEGCQLVGPADMAAVHAVGFDHVRIPFDPVFLRSRLEEPTRSLPKIGALNRAMDMAVAAGLAVIVEFHPPGKCTNAWRQCRPLGNPWSPCAPGWPPGYAGHPADLVVFELLNGPQ